MMKRKIYRTTIFFLACLFFVSCEKGFDELNKNPTGSITTSANGLMTVATQRGSLTWFMFDRAQRLTCNLYAQYNAVDRGFITDYYDPSPAIFTDIWDRTYGDQDTEFAPIFHCQQAIEVTELSGNLHQEGIARIWRVFLFQRMTDMFGDIPYSEAFQSTMPKFDKQEDIYRDFLVELRKAKELITDPGNFPSYGPSELIYNGSVEKWEKFANSLLLRMALRVEKVDKSLSDLFIETIADGPLMSGNDDSNAMQWDGVISNIYFRNPILVTEVFGNTRVSETMVEKLEELNDPRLELYALPAVTDGRYRGLRNGRNALDEASQDDSYFDQFSRLGEAVLVPDGFTYNMHYAEVCFLKAEAASKGMLEGDVQEFYLEGIRAALNLYGELPEDLINSYLESDVVKYDAAKGLQQIAEQKWISLYMNGIEAWIEKRRTGFPEFNAIEFPGALNNGQYPRRLTYSENERALNTTNLNEAVSRLGEDTQLAKVWWDVN